MSVKLTNTLMQKGIQLFTKVKKKMKNKLITLVDKLMLKKRAMIESVNNLLKSSCQIEHHRLRNRWNFLSNLMAGLANYCLNPFQPRRSFQIQKSKLLSS
ncbi:transposase [Candidatus Protochlamydia sp. R18]|uniref:transposase n=1 Tax=Candidatus Protochlamydia sp. R18 TaxID=1353977 RepID=UPI0005A6D3E6